VSASLSAGEIESLIKVSLLLIIGVTISSNENRSGNTSYNTNEIYK
jgi:hypothetical protein